VFEFVLNKLENDPSSLNAHAKTKNGLNEKKAVNSEVEEVGQK
jgi:hypothetical protein